ncbi:MULTISPECIES: efflux transporter outer membrane subunit [Burkholderia]|uniref:RND transporter n=1 Tax=Burkholderia paludis TaxID=1506587 RepID=A0A6P2QW30_9BURK|nr:MULTISPECIES: efflux transporter outer membrane subunit [Burkholderia]CAB3771646.1 Antibiotic efflux pump outer membrane protein ArpC [Burkholderia paludis]VWC27858.1 RND transporter [Burkholderia paludis]
MVAVLAGCASGNGMQPSRVALSPDTLDSGKEISALQRSAEPVIAAPMWWQAFGDAQLDALMEQAARDAPSIQIAESRLQQAEAAGAVAAAGLLPTVDGTASVSANRFPGHDTYSAPYADNTGSRGALGLDLRYHVDFWGKWSKAANAARFRAESAGFEAEDARLVLQTALAAAYLKLDATYKLRDVAAQGLSRREDVLKLQALRIDAGLSTDLNAIEVRDAATQTRADIARYDADIARRRHEIAALLGKTPAFADQLRRPDLRALADPAPVSNVTSLLLGYRPDVAARREAVEAAANEIGVAKAAFYPDVDLIAFAGMQSLGIGYLLRASSTTANLGPAITLPIFEGGRLRANLKGKVAEYDAAVSAYNATIAVALQQVADGIATVKAARIRQQQATVAERQRLHVVDLQRARKRSGLSDAGDLLAAETASLMSQRRVAETDAELADAQVSLIRALGGAWTPSPATTH